MRKITNEELMRPSVEEFVEMEKMPVVVVLDNVRSMQNVGSFFRTGDAFAVEKIILCGITATPPARDIHKTALGAEMTVRWEYAEKTTEAVMRLKEEGYRVLAVEQVEGAVMLNDFRTDEGAKYALVFGNEGSGLPAEFSRMGQPVRIPSNDRVDSLNLSIAAAIGIYGFTQKSK